MSQSTLSIRVPTGVSNDEGSRPQPSYAGYISLSDQYVAVDGVNFMHMGRPSAQIATVLAVCIHLAREAGDWCCFFDASAKKRHLEPAGRFDHIDAYEYLRREYPRYFVEVAARTPADPLILSAAQRNRGLVGSNDTFEGWRQQHPWIALNDRMRRATLYRDHIYFNEEFLFVEDDLYAQMRELESLL